MAAIEKLADADVKRIRRRVRAGARMTDLAEEYGVNRKTIRRRLDALERAESERAERSAETRLRRQGAREKRKLRARERGGAPAPLIESSDPTRISSAPTRLPDPYFDWLDRPKNLSGRALAEANGLVRIRKPDSSARRWVDRSRVEAELDAGWLLEDE